MKNFLEKSKDNLYDYIDYFIILGIVGLVLIIISWRLDLLFVDDSFKSFKNNIVIENEESSSLVEDKIIEENQEIKHKINVPSGSSSYDIANILESNKLISNKSDFIEKAEEMNLSNKLRAGDFELSSNSSLENILTILTK